MDKITTIKSATKYIYEYLKVLNPDVDEEDVYDTIVDEVLESVEYQLSDEDLDILETNHQDREFMDMYLQKKISDYAELLSDIVTDMMSDEILEEPKVI